MPIEILTKCKECRAPIALVIAYYGKPRIVVDARPVTVAEGQKLRLIKAEDGSTFTAAEGQTGYVLHSTTCTAKSKFRDKPTPDDGEGEFDGEED